MKDEFINVYLGVVALVVHKFYDFLRLIGIRKAKPSKEGLLETLVINLVFNPILLIILLLWLVL